MPTNETRPRPRPKAVPEWRDVRRERYRNAGDKSGFRVLPTKVLDSDAFNELSKSAKIVLMLSLGQLDYWVNRGRTASYLTAPSQIPACGISAPGSSALLAAARAEVVTRGDAELGRAAR
jgi:hypothetical protein